MRSWLAAGARTGLGILKMITEKWDIQGTKFALTRRLTPLVKTPIEVLGMDSGGEPIGCVVGELDGFRFAGKFADSTDGPGNFFLHDLHIGAYVGKDGRLDEPIEALERSEEPEALAMINSVTRQAVSIRGTRPFWNRKRQDLEAYAHNLGCPGAFITFSPADLHWRSLYQHMPRYEEWLAASEPERMALSRHLLRQNPYIAAFHFHRRYCLFRDIVVKKKFNVTDYWDRYELQGRGSPHNHGLYWMANGPVPDMADEAARDIFARRWGFHIAAMNPEPNRAMPQGEGNPLSVDPLAPQMQYHVLLACAKENRGPGEDMEGAAANIEAANVADPQRECRFNFPRALRELAAVIRKEGKSYYVFEAARNDSLINHFNPAIILGWLANIDISPCTSLQAVITSSVAAHGPPQSRFSKGEPQPSALLEAFASVLRDTTTHYGPIIANFINLSALAFINSNAMEMRREYQEMHIPKQAINWPYYFREKEGLPEAYAYFCFPKSSCNNITYFLPAIPDMGKFINLTNDILSFYKEELAGEMRNYIHKKADCDGQSILKALQSTSAEAIAAFYRLRGSLGGHEMDLWEAYVTGYILMHIESRRYRIGELGLPNHFTGYAIKVIVFLQD
ncbi:hypothetical protein NQ176_g7543 [Zarea fungicola]|uniref:Uncharacterized protein n=1 Tax=Zarea fungicola TaxID=93591 RepID=A0ACC1MYC9_9HYPO|nr:hypothetical protein NQ176_g7543 [Lecanicillium fungicola]